MTQDSLSLLLVDSHRALEAILEALPAAYRSDPRYRLARAALDEAREQSSVMLLLLPREERHPPAPARAVAAPGPEEEVGFGDLVLRRDGREMSRGGRKIHLTATESRLLELFLRHPSQVLPRGLIFERVWGWDVAATSNLLNVYVGYLRRKTEAGGQARLIHTVRGIGYVLRD